MKVTIKTIVFNGDYANITLTDGKQVSGNTAKEPRFKDLKEGQEVDFDIKEWTKKDGSTMLFANFPKAGGGFGGKFPPKDYTFLKREASLREAVACKEGIEDDQKTLARAESFYQYLNKK